MLAAYSILFLLTAIWGLTFPLVQEALASASPLVFLVLRFTLASLVLPLFLWPKVFGLSVQTARKGIWLGIMLWGGFAFQTFGLAHTTAARSGFLTGTLVPLTALFAWLLFRARIGLWLWIAVGLAFAGIAIMSQPEAGGLNLGDVLTLLCAVSFALQVVFVGRWSNRENEAPLTWLQLVVAAMLSFICLPLAESRLQFSPYLALAVGVTACFGSAFAIWGQMRYQPRVSPAAAAVIYAFEPVFAGVAAWLIQGHVPPPATLVGAACIVAGMILTVAPVSTKVVPS